LQANQEHGDVMMQFAYNLC